MKTGYKVCDAMTKSPVISEPRISLQDAAKIMAAQHVGALVVKKKGKLTGIVTEQDIVRKAIALGADPRETSIESVMERKIITIPPAADIYDALMRMRDNNIRHLPVVTAGKMIGLLTLKDILKIQPQLFELMVEKFELREETRKPIARMPATEGHCEECGEFAPLKEVSGSLLCEWCR